MNEHNLKIAFPLICFLVLGALSTLYFAVVYILNRINKKRISKKELYDAYSGESELIDYPQNGSIK